MAFADINKEKYIIQLFRHGDAMAMDELYNYYSGYLTGVCSRYITDDDVKDVLQESFIKIFTKICDFDYRGSGSLKAWLTRVVVNEALNYLRHKSSTSFINADSNLPDVADSTDVDVSSISESTLVEMIQQLPPGYRSVFNLYVMEEYSHNEIAKILGIKPATSASQFHRARLMMERMVKEYQNKNR
nr:RNA polymerase sigma factor [Prevotella sp.]